MNSAGGSQKKSKAAVRKESAETQEYESYLLQSHCCWSSVDERLCTFTPKDEIEVLDTALSRTFLVWCW